MVLGETARRARRALSLLPVAAIVAGIELGLRTTRLPRLCRILGIRPEFIVPDLTRTPVEPAAFAPTPAERAALADAATVLARGPFPSTCLRRALAAGWVLRRHDPALRLGVAKSGGRVIAHAWLIVDGVNLDPTGAADFSPLSAVSEPGRAR